MQDLRTLFINMHHILNEYRPHQARESAIEMMQDHLDRTRTETLAIRTQVDKAKRLLEGLGSLGIGESTSAAAVGAGADVGAGAGAGASTGAGATQAAEQQQSAKATNSSNVDWEHERRIWASVDDLFS